MTGACAGYLFPQDAKKMPESSRRKKRFSTGAGGAYPETFGSRRRRLGFDDHPSTQNDASRKNDDDDLKNVAWKNLDHLVDGRMNDDDELKHLSHGDRKSAAWMKILQGGDDVQKMPDETLRRSQNAVDDDVEDRKCCDAAGTQMNASTMASACRRRDDENDGSLGAKVAEMLVRRRCPHSDAKKPSPNHPSTPPRSH